MLLFCCCGLCVLPSETSAFPRTVRRASERCVYAALGSFKGFFSFLFSLFLRPLPQVQRFRTRRRRRLVCKVIIVITRHGTEQNDGAWSFRSFRALSWLIDPRPAESLPSHHSLAGVWNTFGDLYRLDCGLSWARSPSH